MSVKTPPEAPVLVATSTGAPSLTHPAAKSLTTDRYLIRLQSGRNEVLTVEQPANPTTDRHDEPKQAWSTPRIEELDVTKDTAGSVGISFDIMTGS